MSTTISPQVRILAVVGPETPREEIGLLMAGVTESGVTESGVTE